MNEPTIADSAHAKIPYVEWQASADTVRSVWLAVREVPAPTHRRPLGRMVGALPRHPAPWFLVVPSRHRSILFSTEGAHVRVGLSTLKFRVRKRCRNPVTYPCSDATSELA